MDWIVSTEPLKRMIEFLYPDIRNGRIPDLKNIAYRAGVSARTIERIINDEIQTCRLTTADKICVGLGIPTASVYLSEYEQPRMRACDKKLVSMNER